MKYIIAALLFVVGIGYFSMKASTTLAEKKAEKVQSFMETSLFPFVIAAQPKENITSRPMWVEETSTTLKVYCEYLGDKLPETRENTRNETVSIIKKWAETQKKNYNFVYVVFTDEVINPDKK